MAGGRRPLTTWGRVKRLGEPLWQAGRAWYRDNAMRLSAAVAVYAILSLAPLLVISIKVAGVVLSEEAASRQVERQARSFLGPHGAQAVNAMLVSAGKEGAGTWATIVSVAFLIYTASGVFVEFRDALDSIWRISAQPQARVWPVVRERLLSVGMVLAVGFLLLVTQVVTTVLTVLSEYVAGGVGWTSVAIDFVSSTMLLTVVFALLFRFLPDARVRWRHVLAGAAVTAGLFKIGQLLQALYFAHGATASIYGAAGSFMVVLLWVYYSCWIVFYGAELIQVFARRGGERPVPVPEGSILRPTPAPSNERDSAPAVPGHGR